MNHRKIAARFFNLALAFAIAIITLPTQAAVPQTLNYQGQLTNAAGVPVNGLSPVNITFSLYTVPTGVTPPAVWSETQPVTVTNGLYSVTLGQTTPLTPALFGVPLYLGITVETDAEMTPRIVLSSAPYAMQSSCTPGDQMDCYTGASATRNIGACKSGKRNCGLAGWEQVCSGEVLPVAEVLNGIDDDCNGVIDNGVGCFIGGTAYLNGATNPANSCQACNISLTTTAWTALPSTTVCNDGNLCTTADHCDGTGSCVGTPVSVNDGNACTTDSCNPGTGVSHTPLPDGSACGAGQTCSAGVCQGASVCGDGLISGTEACDDGNTTSGDGCSSTCTVEVGFACSGVPSVCTSVQCTTNADCAGTNTACQTSICNASNQCVVTYAPSSTMCRASSGVCDVAEYCSGTSGTCPTNSFAPSSLMCRASAGACDVAEYCSGTNANCPTDIFAPSTTVCRASAGVCDAVEFCAGTSGTCPANGFVPDGTACNDGNACTATDYCQSGTCVGANPLSCTGGQVCNPTTGVCQ